MRTDTTLQLLKMINRLKRVPRTGWLLRGIQPAESVADHSFGVAFTALLLADQIHQPLDRGRLLSLALLHDLAEVITGDIPWPAMQFFPAESKKQAEEQIMRALFESWPAGDTYLQLWDEYKAGSSLEARLVQDADRLELLLQADAYERAGAAGLEEFWASLGEDQFAFPESWQIAQQLLTEHH